MLVVCSLCKEHKPRSGFYPLAKRESGIDWYCKDCRKLVSREHRANHAESARARYTEWYNNNKQHKSKYSKNHNLSRYGVTAEEYQRLLKRQKNKCALCKRAANEKKALGVDHCHKTGAIRGLLCDSCNLSLGGFKDNIETLKAAISYLRKHQKNESN